MRNSIRDRFRRLGEESELCIVSPERHRYEKASLTAGFTLVEMVVAVGVFMISVLIIVGSLVMLSNASRKARTERIVTDNLGAAIDSMSRNIRMGNTFHCGCEANAAQYATRKDCALPMDTLGNGGDQCLAFEGPSGSSLTPNDQIVFQLFGGHLRRSTNGGATFLDMTAPEIVITNLKFYLNGSAAGIDQPVVSVIIQGKSGAQAKTASKFNLQTTIAPRTPNF